MKAVYWYLLFVVVIIGLLLAGCSTSGTTVGTLQADRPSVQLTTDTAQVQRPTIAPIAEVAEPTLPRAIEEFDEELEGETMEVRSVEVSQETVIVTTPHSQLTYNPPAYGETLHVRPEGAGVEGEPEDQEVEIEVREEERESALTRILQLPAWILAGLLALSLFAVISIIRALR